MTRNRGKQMNENERDNTRSASNQKYLEENNNEVPEQQNILQKTSWIVWLLYKVFLQE